MSASFKSLVKLMQQKMGALSPGPTHGTFLPSHPRIATAGSLCVAVGGDGDNVNCYLWPLYHGLGIRGVGGPDQINGGRLRECTGASLSTDACSLNP